MRDLIARFGVWLIEFVLNIGRALRGIPMAWRNNVQPALGSASASAQRNWPGAKKRSGAFVRGARRKTKRVQQFTVGRQNGWKAQLVVHAIFWGIFLFWLGWPTLIKLAILVWLIWSAFDKLPPQGGNGGQQANPPAAQANGGNRQQAAAQAAIPARNPRRRIYPRRRP